MVAFLGALAVGVYENSPVMMYFSVPFALTAFVWVTGKVMKEAKAGWSDAE